MPFVNPKGVGGFSHIRCAGCGAMSRRPWPVTEWEVWQNPESKPLRVYFSGHKFAGNAWCPSCQRSHGWGVPWTQEQIDEAMATEWVPAGVNQAGPGAGAAAAAAAAGPEAAPAVATAADVEALRAEVRELQAAVHELRQQVATLDGIVQGGWRTEEPWQAGGPWLAATTWKGQPWSSWWPEEAGAKPGDTQAPWAAWAEAADGRPGDAQGP